MEIHHSIHTSINASFHPSIHLSYHPFTHIRHVYDVTFGPLAMHLTFGMFPRILMGPVSKMASSVAKETMKMTAVI